jgi:hypothetical protein
MNREQVVFLTRMICEELMEFLTTVKEDNENVKTLLFNIVEKSNLPLNDKKPTTDIGLLVENIDAVVDIEYYMLNACCKNGLNAEKIFNLVHDANMNKKFSDGTFHRNDIGKVIKPPGWQEPDVKGEVERWVKEGSWTN